MVQLIYAKQPAVVDDMTFEEATHSTPPAQPSDAAAAPAQTGSSTDEYDLFDRPFPPAAAQEGLYFVPLDPLNRLPTVVVGVAAARAFFRASLWTDALAFFDLENACNCALSMAPAPPDLRLITEFGGRLAEMLRRGASLRVDKDLGSGESGIASSSNPFGIKGNSDFTLDLDTTICQIRAEATAMRESHLHHREEPPRLPSTPVRKGGKAEPSSSRYDIDDDGVPTLRLLHDGTHGVDLNYKIRVRDQARMPTAADAKRQLREQAACCAHTGARIQAEAWDLFWKEEKLRRELFGRGDQAKRARIQAEGRGLQWKAEMPVTPPRRVDNDEAGTANATASASAASAAEAADAGASSEERDDREPRQSIPPLQSGKRDELDDVARWMMWARNLSRSRVIDSSEKESQSQGAASGPLELAPWRSEPGGRLPPQQVEDQLTRWTREVMARCSVVHAMERTLAERLDEEAAQSDLDRIAATASNVSALEDGAM